MKKSLLALALMGAVSAQAADVVGYGIIDMGPLYQKYDYSHKASQDTIMLKSTLDAGSRVGLKGQEDLGNGTKLSFILENGFYADSGKITNDNRLFGREMSMTLSGPAGQLSVGRLGNLTAATGSYNYFFKNAESFNGGTAFTKGVRLDNSITYQTPSFAGTQFALQYSFETGAELVNGEIPSENAEENTNNRYFGLGMRHTSGNFTFVSTIDQYLWANEKDNDGLVFSFGGNYDLGYVQPYVALQFSRDVKDIAGAKSYLGAFKSSTDTAFNEKYKDFNGVTFYDGYAMHVGTKSPLGNGLLMTGLYHAGAESDQARGGDLKIKYYGGMVRYLYFIGKRSNLIIGASYAKNTLKQGAFDEDMKYMEFYFGANTSF